MKSISLALKSLAVKTLPAPGLQLLRNLAWRLKGQRQGRTLPMELVCVQPLREATQDALRDATFIENELLPRLGLNDEGLIQIPDELHPVCGRGLRIWQYPNQFAPYLAFLAGLNLRSYLEIGVRHGGTFVCTVEYLSRFHQLTKAVAMDLGACPSLEEYARTKPECRFIQMDSHSQEFREFLGNHALFDLALIDGDHSEDGCWQDFVVVREKASVLAFHDIVSDAVPGVGAVWRKLRASSSDEYEFFEFTEQYASVHKRTGQRFLGIGVAVPRNRAART
jgi:hypothetical protein